MDVDTKVEEEDKTRKEERETRDRRDSRRHHSDHWEPDDRKSERRSSRRDKRSRSRSRSRHRSASPIRSSRRHSRRRSRTRSPGGRSRSRSRSRSPDHHRSSHRSSGRDRGDRDRERERVPRSLGGPINADHEEAVEFAKISKRENRVYVGNLSYDVKYGDLIEFMRGAGEVLFAEVLVTPSGVSKGCGIVEFSTQEEAQKAIRELGEAPLLGRPVFIREDRELESRFGATPVPGKMGMALAHGGGFGGGNAFGGPRPLPNVGGPGNQLYVGNLPYQAGWQDLKDLFRSAGNIVRADINIGPDGRAKGSGTVIFETVKDAQAAITMYHGFEWYGRTLEVREDRFAGLSGFRGGGRGLAAGGRGYGRGGYGFGGRGFGGRGGGGFGRGGGGGGGGGGGFGGDGRQFSNDIYADYDGPNSAVAAGPGPQLRMDGAGYSGIPTGPGGYGAYAGGFVSAEPSQQIMVRNLPWSTANEDLVELFETTGSVEQAEILFDGTRSKGAGVVQFATTEESETAIAKFSGYMYGGRPLDVRFNDRWHTFTPTAAKGTHMQTS